MLNIRVGQTVCFIQPGHETPYNGHRDHPAIITKVWGPRCFNLKVFFDCGPIRDVTSVGFHNTYEGGGIDRAGITEPFESVMRPAHITESEVNCHRAGCDADHSLAGASAGAERKL